MPSLENLRHSEERIDVGIRFSLRRQYIFVQFEGTRIATTGVHTGLAMTGRLESARRFFMRCKTVVTGTARRPSPTIIFILCSLFSPLLVLLLRRPLSPVCALGTSPRRGSASRQRFRILRRFLLYAMCGIFHPPLPLSHVCETTLTGHSTYQGGSSFITHRA